MYVARKWRVTRLLLAIAVCAPLTGAVGKAQTTYTYTVIADLFNCSNYGAPALNNNGEVAFGARCGAPIVPAGDGIVIRRGEGGALTPIYTWQTSSGTQNSPQVDVLSINDSGVVAFGVNGPCGFNTAIWTGNGGPTDVVYDRCTAPAPAFKEVSRPSISNTGAVAFMAVSSTSSVGYDLIVRAMNGALVTIAGPGTATTSLGPLSAAHEPTINNNDVVGFTGGGALGNPALFTGSGGALTTIRVGGASTFNSINDSGRMAFLGGQIAVQTGDGGPLTTIATRTFEGGAYQGFLGETSINTSGKVAFRASLPSGVTGVFTGPNPVTDAVLKSGDVIAGFGTVTLVGMLREAINDSGQIAMVVTFNDSGITKRAIIRADPPKTPPDPPTGVSGTRGNGQVTVSFTPPLHNGNSPITSYTVTASPGGATASGSGSPLTVTGLTNGTPYTFTVTATNAIGTSLPSAASAPVTPATTPGAPTDVTGTRGNGQVTVSFTAPNNGGDPITSYTVTASPGGASASGTASPITVTGLTNGTAYTFTVRATNTVGVGPASAASSPVTPATVPSAPTSVSAIGGNAQATVSFLAPASNGGDAITSYTVTASPGGANVTGTASPITVTGLTNGTSYTFTVRANNSVGSSAASSPSNAITPGVPGTPVNFTVTPSGLSILGTWTSTGGTATAHTLQVATSAAFSAVILTVPLGPASFFSLDAPPGTVGTFFLRVIASNPFGTSAPTAIASVTLPGPLTAPASPVLQNAVVAANNVALNWIPTAGGPPSSYVLLVGSSSGASNVGAFPMGTATSISSSATNGTYFVRVQASNAGGSAISNEISFTVGTPCVAPAPPTSPSVSRSGNTITVNWGAPATGSSPFTYTIVAGTSAGASNLGSFPIGSATTTSSQVPSGTYFLRVRAANACGTSGDSAEVSIVVP